MLLRDMGHCDPLGRVVHYCWERIISSSPSVSAAGKTVRFHSIADLELSGTAGPRKIERGPSMLQASLTHCGSRMSEPPFHRPMGLPQPKVIEKSK